MSFPLLSFRSKDSMSPVCGIFLTQLAADVGLFLCFVFCSQLAEEALMVTPQSQGWKHRNIHLAGCFLNGLWHDLVFTYLPLFPLPLFSVLYYVQIQIVNQTFVEGGGLENKGDNRIVVFVKFRLLVGISDNPDDFTQTASSPVESLSCDVGQFVCVCV